MEFFGIALVVKSVIEFVSKVMDGKKTKAGLGIVAVGGALPVLSLFGVDVTPDAVIGALDQVLGLFGYHIAADAAQTGQTLLGSIFTFVGGVVALYGYIRKGQLVTK